MSSMSDPPTLSDPDANLTALRAELDRLDDAMHGLLQERASIVGQVARAKGGVALRPGREAIILRRLLAAHRGALPPVALVRIWRELFAATTSMQGPFTISVCETDRDRSMTACAREHFGASTPLHSVSTPDQAIDDVSRGGAAAAVLPMPSEGAGSPSQWWTAWLSRRQPGLHVVARLPFWAPRPEGAPMVDALVIAAVAPDPSGNDRTLLGVATPEGAGLVAALTALGLPPRQVLRHHRAGATDMLVELDGFITDDDPRLAGLLGTLGPPVVLGAYACPL